MNFKGQSARSKILNFFIISDVFDRKWIVLDQILVGQTKLFIFNIFNGVAPVLIDTGLFQYLLFLTVYFSI